MESDPKLLVEKDIKVVCMPMETVHEVLLKADMLDKEQKKKKRKKRSGKAILFVSQVVCGSLHSRLLAFSRASVGNDE